jgi:hypothetical protein
MLLQETLEEAKKEQRKTMKVVTIGRLEVLRAAKG